MTHAHPTHLTSCTAPYCSFRTPPAAVHRRQRRGRRRSTQCGQGTHRACCEAACWPCRAGSKRSSCVTSTSMSTRCDARPAVCERAHPHQTTTLRACDAPPGCSADGQVWRECARGHPSLQRGRCQGGIRQDGRREGRGVLRLGLRLRATVPPALCAQCLPVLPACTRTACPTPCVQNAMHVGCLGAAHHAHNTPACCTTRMHGFPLIPPPAHDLTPYAC